MNILLIEDNPVDAQAIREALSRAQAPLELAHITTLTELSDTHERSPDLVLLDLSLGDSEGLGTIRGARARLGDVPIVVLTGDDSEELAFDALREGAQDYLVKGAYSTDTLMRSMRYAIERHGLKASLARADRLAVVGQLSAGVAHEVSNPANFVMGNALSLEEHLDRMAKSLVHASQRGLSPEAAAEMLTEIGRMRVLVKESLSGVDRIAKVIRELQDYARLGERRLSLVDVNTIVRESSKLVFNSLRHKAKLTLELNDVVRIAGDLSKLEQVVTNLLVNANHAIGDGSPAHNEVRVRTWMDQQDTTAAAVVIMVEDTGAGIPPEQLQRIFEPFFTTKPKGRGTGLGLATVYGIVTQAGGGILMNSAPGAGTAFTIVLPATDADLTAAEPAGPQVRARGGETVLVVEDEDALREVTCRILTRNGYRVLPAAGGPEAVKIAENHPEPVHLLLTDVIMPHMLGTEVAAKVRDLRPDCRILYMSGYAQPIVAAQGPLDPELKLVEKPFSEPDLLRWVRDVLDG